VAEGERVAGHLQDPRGDARIDRIGTRVDGRAQQPQLDRTGDDRGELRDRSRLRSQGADPRRDGIAHRRRDCARGSGEDLGHEERVATRHAMQLGRVASGPVREDVDRLLRQRRRVEPQHDLGRQRSEHAADLRPLVQRLAATGQHDAAARTGETPPEQRHEVERPVVGPVQVVDDQD
jgi:hypothetical protein